MFTLIVFMTLGGAIQDNPTYMASPAIVNVPGFSSLKACNAAAPAVLNMVEEYHEQINLYSLQYVCVQVK